MQFVLGEFGLFCAVLLILYAFARLSLRSLESSEDEENRAIARKMRRELELLWVTAAVLFLMVLLGNWLLK